MEVDSRYISRLSILTFLGDFERFKLKGVTYNCSRTVSNLKTNYSNFLGIQNRIAWFWNISKTIRLYTQFQRFICFFFVKLMQNDHVFRSSCSSLSNRQKTKNFNRFPQDNKILKQSYNPSNCRSSGQSLRQLQFERFDVGGCPSAYKLLNGIRV